MTISSRAFARVLSLRRGEFDDVEVQHDIKVTMTDGATLLADLWSPSSHDSADEAGRAHPVIVVRTPYGRGPLGPVARLFAERGYRTLVQSCRGTFGSEGVWEPFRNERSDGLDTLRWLGGQPWFGGSAATFGASYLGLTQWAVAAEVPDFVGAMALNVTTSHFRDAVVYPGGSFALETGAAWLYLLAHQEKGLWSVLASQLRARRVTASSSLVLPLSLADKALLGSTAAGYQDWLVHDRPGDPWWDPVDFRAAVAQMVPSSLVGGWYDIFLPQQVDDYVALREAGRDARLVIGPWTHASPRGLGAAVADALDLFDTHLLGRAPRHRARVRLFVMGSKRWVELDDWPPPATPESWHLHPDGVLDPALPPPSEPDRYRYDPADPTPSRGGPSLAWTSAGSRDQRRREERPDVVVYTSSALRTDLTIAGPVTAEIYLDTDNPNIDVFVRLCDVSASGASRNVSDGVLRLEPSSPATGTPPAGPGDPAHRRLVKVRMWPTAHTFRRNHRIRLQVSSGAHPLFARNPGGGEPLGSATSLISSDIAVLHDPVHPSAVVLPVSPI